MSTHSIIVKVCGPVKGLGAEKKIMLHDRVVSIVSDRGFKRKSQQDITLEDVQSATTFTVDVSIPKMLADRSSTQVVESLYDDLVGAVLQYTKTTCVLTKHWNVH